MSDDKANERIKIAHERILQHHLSLRLKRDKQQRDDAAIALRVLGDARVKAVEAAPISNTEKLEAVGLYMFGKFWDPRPIPDPSKEK